METPSKKPGRLEGAGCVTVVLFVDQQELCYGPITNPILAYALVKRLQKIGVQATLASWVGAVRDLPRIVATFVEGSKPCEPTK